MLLKKTYRYSHEFYRAETTFKSICWAFKSLLLFSKLNLFDITTKQPDYIVGLLSVVPSSTRAKNRGSFEARFLANGGQNPVNVRM
jgi:hypothetical protein